MKIENTGWLSALLSDAVAEHQPPEWVPSKGVTAFLRECLRPSGLLYGTPVGAPLAGAGGAVLLVEVIRKLAHLGLDIAILTEAPPGPRRDQLASLFAAMVHENVEAPIRAEQWARLEHRLSKRAITVRGHATHFLALHNGALYADANLFVRLAMDFFTSRPLFSKRTARRLRFAARQKAFLVGVLTTVACLDRPAGFWTRRAILRQIRKLDLPEGLREALRQRLKGWLRRPPPLSQVVEGAQSATVRHFILEQAILASLVDERRRGQRKVFLEQLSAALSISPKELEKLEVLVAEFYAENRSVVDVFKVSRGAGAMADEMVESIQRTLENNFHRLWQEVKETGELSVLLSRAARGQRLTSEERRKVRAQLIDVAKAVPALAIFAAPGGLLLLIALAKVLPFSILPSAFQKPPLPPGEGPSTGKGPGQGEGAVDKRRAY